LQPSSLVGVVVEHKAQPHFEGLLSLSLFAVMVYNAAHWVHKIIKVPRIAFGMCIAV
jgi:hypothetical protein